MTQTKSLSFSASISAHALALGAVLVLPLLWAGPLPPVTQGDLSVPWALPLPRVALAQPTPTPTPTTGTKPDTRGGGPRGGTVMPLPPGPAAPLVAPTLNAIGPLTDDDPTESETGDGRLKCWGVCDGKKLEWTGPETVWTAGQPGAAAPQAPIVAQPYRRSGHEPIYPALARAARVQGTVILECRVGTNGRVEDIAIRSGHPLLDQAAIEAVRQWTYMPTLINGKPVPVLVTVTVKFRLR